MVCQTLIMFGVILPSFQAISQGNWALKVGSHGKQAICSSCVKLKAVIIFKTIYSFRINLLYTSMSKCYIHKQLTSMKIHYVFFVHHLLNPGVDMEIFGNVISNIVLFRSSIKTHVTHVISVGTWLKDLLCGKQRNQSFCPFHQQWKSQI